MECTGKQISLTYIHEDKVVVETAEGTQTLEYYPIQCTNVDGDSSENIPATSPFFKRAVDIVEAELNKGGVEEIEVQLGFVNRSTDESCGNPPKHGFNALRDEIRRISPNYNMYVPRLRVCINGEHDDYLFHELFKFDCLEWIVTGWCDDPEPKTHLTNELIQLKFLYMGKVFDNPEKLDDFRGWGLVINQCAKSGVTYDYLKNIKWFDEGTSTITFLGLIRINLTSEQKLELVRGAECKPWNPEPFRNDVCCELTNTSGQGGLMVFSKTNVFFAIAPDELIRKTITNYIKDSLSYDLSPRK